ncbi:hypothetical protein [Methylomonas sp. AM2-LC]|uniref:hypothetical protein n=1 Tax=Methylomonas sp. AM2-LC TaxID=3153301 RepID=UPI003263B711
MKKNNSMQKLLILLLIPVMTVFLSACSDDKTENASVEKPAQAKHAKANHIDQGEASDSVKQKFEKQFAKNCVARELKNSINKDVDEKRFSDSCECIAKKIAEDLSDLDAEKYLQEHEDTQTLEIKFDHAAYFCLQSKPQPKGPHLFGKE